MRRGGNIPTAFNAANEKAVALFLDRKIAYQQIPEMIESCMEAADFIANPTVDEILETEAAAYEHIAGKWGKVFCMKIIIAILIFSLIIIFHELGHFLLAKANGIRVNEFCLGLGPKVFGITKGETTYSLHLFPDRWSVHDGGRGYGERGRQGVREKISLGAHQCGDCRAGIQFPDGVCLCFYSVMQYRL